MDPNHNEFTMSSNHKEKERYYICAFLLVSFSDRYHGIDSCKKLLHYIILLFFSQFKKVGCSFASKASTSVEKP